MNPSGEIAIRTQGRAGRITLTRPSALNALTHDMVLAMEAALGGWRDDASVELVIFDAEGDRAFCAGGDIEKLYATGRAGDFRYGRKFWTDEYRLNALIAEYDKPIVAFMQGFVMGGGVGIGCHTKHRVVGETTKIAMPECGIGLIPDVGGSYLLARAPRRAGWYLGMTGARMNAADAIHAGFADLFVSLEKWPGLVDSLAETGDPSVVADAACPAGSSSLAENASIIERFFSAGTAVECVAVLEADTRPWATQAARSVRRGCPLSVACTHELLERNASAASVREALAMELRFTSRSMSEGEFLEGVRAQIIDKDRDPRWATERLEAVTAKQVSAMLRPLEPAG